MGDVNDEQSAAVEPGAGAGAQEGSFTEPSTSEIEELYKATGVKAPVPTGKAKGRPKATDGGDKKAAKQDDEGGKSEKGRGNDDSKKQPKTASASDSDGADGDEADKTGKKVSSKDGKDGEKDSKISGDGDEDADGVQKAESDDNGEAPKSSEGDADKGDEESGEKAGESENSEAKDSEEEKGKRPGKSNPEVEKRFQKLTGEVKERDQVIEDLQKQLRDKDQAVEQSKIDKEDPVYTIDDFRKVQDKDGNVIDLDPERAELAWRRWKDGYDQRTEERQAKANHAAAQAEREAEVSRKLMESSVKAYDALVALQDEYPELVSTSGKYDPDFAAEAMPIIEEALLYLEGTEPGNPEGKMPIVTGFKINPKKILAAMKTINSKKRSLPLNGVNDSVESTPTVNVPHSRSSDPTAQAANELYKGLGIKKRF